MQNKANFPNVKVDVTLISAKAYENKQCLRTPAKQTQTNPILSRRSLGEGGQSQFQVGSFALRIKEGRAEYQGL